AVPGKRIRTPDSKDGGNAPPEDQLRFRLLAGSNLEWELIPSGPRLLIRRFAEHDRLTQHDEAVGPRWKRTEYHRVALDHRCLNGVPLRGDNEGKGGMSDLGPVLSSQPDHDGSALLELDRPQVQIPAGLEPVVSQVGRGVAEGVDLHRP